MYARAERAGRARHDARRPARARARRGRAAGGGRRGQRHHRQLPRAGADHHPRLPRVRRRRARLGGRARARAQGRPEDGAHDRRADQARRDRRGRRGRRAEHAAEPPHAAAARLRDGALPAARRARGGHGRGRRAQGGDQVLPRERAVEQDRDARARRGEAHEAARLGAREPHPERAARHEVAAPEPARARGGGPQAARRGAAEQRRRPQEHSAAGRSRAPRPRPAQSLPRSRDS